MAKYKVMPIIISILFIRCSETDGPTTMQGVVTNGITKEPIEGVEISAFETRNFFTRSSNNPVEGTAFSKEDGSYLLELAASETAKHYRMTISKTDLCRRVIQSVGAGKTHFIDLDLYGKSILNTVYVLHDQADSLVEGYDSSDIHYDGDEISGISLGECSACFYNAGYYYVTNCFSDDPGDTDVGFFLTSKKQPGEVWDELNFSLESFQGLKFSMWYKIYNNKQLLKTDTLNFSLEQAELTVEITL